MKRFSNSPSASTPAFLCVFVFALLNAGCAKLSWKLLDPSRNAAQDGGQIGTKNGDLIVTEVEPSEALPGSDITVHGKMLSKVSQVRVGDESVPFTLLNEETLTAHIPETIVGGALKVIAASAFFEVKSEHFRVMHPPRITRATPVKALVGTQIRIQGSHLKGETGDTLVSLNGKEAQILSLGEREIVTRVPASATTGFWKVQTTDGEFESTESFEVVPAPVFAGFAPTMGAVGTDLVISGSNFRDVTSVTIGGGMASLKAVSATQIVVSVTALSKTGKIAVSSAWGELISSQIFTVTASQPTGPAVMQHMVTGINPNRAKIGDTIAITGQNFTGFTGVEFAPGVKASIVSSSDTQIQVKVPDGAMSGALKVIKPGFKTAQSTTLTVVYRPLLMAMNPASGLVGDEVTLTGENFVAPLTVTLGGRAVAGLVIDSQQKLRFKVPAGAGSGFVRVTNEAGSADSSQAFVIEELPSITDFMPKSGKPGVTVTIAGNWLSDVTTVFFGALPASITSRSATQLVVKVPMGAASGVIKVQKSNPRLNAQSTASFEVVAPTKFEVARDVIHRNCISCHASGGTSPNMDLSTEAQYLGVMGLVVPGDSGASLIIKRMRYVSPVPALGTMPAGGNTSFTQADAVAVVAWIDSLPKSNTGGGTVGSTDNTPPPAPSCANPFPRPTTGYRRLSKVEYINTLSDLLTMRAGGYASTIMQGLNTQLSYFPPENSSEFESMDTQLSPSHAKFFFETAVKVADLFQSNNAAVAALTRSCSSSPNDTCLTSFVRDFGLLAFRRPLSTTEIAEFKQFYNERTQYGFRDLIARFLSSPHFLMHIEADGEVVTGQSRVLKVDSYTLVSRLAYEFWESMPDQNLLSFAASHYPIIDTSSADYKNLVESVFANARTQKMTAHFYKEWLQLDRRIPNFNTTQSKAYDTFAQGQYVNASGHDHRAQMMDEIQELAKYYTWTKPNAKFEELFTSPYSFAKGADLARLYNLPVWDGNPANLRSFPAGAPRGGLLTRAAMVASETEITHPFAKGAFILRNILCEELGNPPANAADTPVPNAATRRLRLEGQTSGASCIGCHVKINPMGLSLESYDGLGRYRTDETFYDRNTGNISGVEPGIDTAIDASIVLGNGATARNAAEFSALIGGHEKTRRCFVRKFYRFSQHRNEDSASGDSCMLTSLYARLSGPDGTLQGMFKELALQPSFPYRTLDADMTGSATGTGSNGGSAGGSAGGSVGGGTQLPSTLEIAILDQAQPKSFDGMPASAHNFGTQQGLNVAANMPFSFEGVFRTDADYGVLVSLRSRGNGNPLIDIAIGKDGAGNDAPGKLVVAVRADAESSAPATLSSQLSVKGAWHHFVLTRDAAGSLRLWLDGADQGSATRMVNGAITTDYRAVGYELKWEDEKTFFFTPTVRGLTGAVNKVRYYARKLESADVSSRYNTLKALFAGYTSTTGALPPPPAPPPPATGGGTSTGGTNTGGTGVGNTSPGLVGTYFHNLGWNTTQSAAERNESFFDQIYTHVDSAIAMTPGTGAAPAGLLRWFYNEAGGPQGKLLASEGGQTGRLSVSWNGYLSVPQDGNYQFCAKSSGWFKFYVDRAAMGGTGIPANIQDYSSDPILYDCVYQNDRHEDRRRDNVNLPALEDTRCMNRHTFDRASVGVEYEERCSSAMVSLKAGTKYKVRLDFKVWHAGGGIELRYKKPGAATSEVIPASSWSH